MITLQNDVKKKLERVKGIIFDMDGTLIDSVGDMAKFSNKILKQNGLSIHPLDKYIEWVGNGARVLIRHAVPQEIEGAPFEKILQDYLSLYEHGEHTESRLYPGIPELLTQLTQAKVPITVLTNKPQAVLEKTVKSYFAQWHFEIVEGQLDGRPRKPDPTMAFDIAKRLQLQPEEIVFVGDSYVDVNTGKNAGMMTICLSNGYDERENIEAEAPDLIVEKQADLLDVLSFLCE